MHRKPFLFVAVAVWIFSAQAFGSADSGRIRRAARPVQGEYIVVLADNADVTHVSDELLRTHGGARFARYTNTIRGFAARLTEAQAEALSRDPRVAWVEENAVVELATTQDLTQVITGYPSGVSLRHLDRIDRTSITDPFLNSSFQYCRTGTGVRIYVVDTGVFPSHPEFQPGARVDTAPGLAAYLAAQGLGLGSTCWDLEHNTANANHGTAVASIAAGDVFGVAKGATLVDARAFPCNALTTVARINAVLDWIPTDPNRFVGGSPVPSVVNMSFGEGFYSTEPGVITPDANGRSMDAILDSFREMQPPIIAVAAAGNQAADSWWTRPAHSPGVISVGGLSFAADVAWSGSNYRVDLYAPVENVESATFVSNGSRFQVRSELTSLTSGTSFAAPVVSELIARYLQIAPWATAEQALAYVVSESNRSLGLYTGPAGFTAPVVNIPMTGAYQCQ